MRRHLGVAGLIATAFLLNRLVRYEIGERSMQPVLEPGDWVIGLRRPRRIRSGDVVVVSHPHRADLEIVKRVAGIEGDAVSGEPLGPGLLWLVGDNPGAGSVDSTTFGPIDVDTVRARIVARYRPWPPRRI